MGFSKNKEARVFGINNILLFLILIVAAALRFYRYPEIPFTYDEFSAWFRTQFDNFNDLIYYGVKTTDTHPAGVQVFEYYWIKAFGGSEPVVKFPFTVMGLLSILLSYKIAKKWFNPTVGLLTAAFLSSIQYMVMYSQIARPYISGLFLSLLMVWFWDKVVFESRRNHIRNLIGYVIVSALCAYNHHFTLLFAAMVGFTGLFFIKREYLFHYIIGGLLIFVLYVPHLSIFFVQLNRGGVESWLGKPVPGFFFQFLNYVLHYSLAMKAILIIVIALSFIMLSKNLKQSNKYRIVSLGWFAATYLIGYIYSVKVNALLQYSILIFTFPFLVIFAFSFFKDVKPLVKSILVSAIVILSVYTLIEKRKHYQYFYTSGYNEIIKESAKTWEILGKENVTTLFGTNRKIQDYYLEKHNMKDEGFSYIDSNYTFTSFRKFISTVKTPYIIFGHAENIVPEYLQIIQNKFPYLVEKKTWFTSDFQVFSKKETDFNSQLNQEEVIFKTGNGFEQTQYGWSAVDENLIIDTIYNSGVHSFFIDKNTEYAAFFSIPLDSIIENQNNIVQISVAAYFPDSVLNMSLISEIRAGDELIDWRDSQFRDFVSRPNEWQNVYLSILLSDLKIDKKGLMLKVGIWNNKKQSCFVDDLEIKTIKGNELIYGLLEDFE
ncbi:MAG: hypothetical protein GXO89_04540 [Chlorobi bacterium]|nr:hypothetical protein [Chlorobiota bacterium]